MEQLVNAFDYTDSKIYVENALNFAGFFTKPIYCNVELKQDCYVNSRFKLVTAEISKLTDSHIWHVGSHTATLVRRYSYIAMMSNGLATLYMK
ncbi:hypothetical protein [Coriobacterium glomerans]|uniref:hypothetical protein n=1 Tax=Coriobacterium glomerans TaxID=33871 RepID=UPI00155AD2C4|nr:hypothetical protein [Coriobacterium glomerans]